MPKFKTTPEFIKDAKKIHYEKYDYSKTEYKSVKSKVTITCPLHGDFLQDPNRHLNGGVCPECGRLSRNSKNTKSHNEFIDKASLVHNGKYDYSKTKYISCFGELIIICPEHGEFMQSPSWHLSGGGCKECTGRTKLSNEEFIEKSSQKHNNKYNYSKTHFSGFHNKITIICPKHGEFIQIAGNHLKGCDCPKCSLGKDERAWLSYMTVPDTKENRQVSIWIKQKRYKVDGFIPETNTIYEYNGDFWHGNPVIYKSSDINKQNKKTFGELYEETQTKRKSILDAGYKLIEIWESDWKLQRQCLLDK